MKLPIDRILASLICGFAQVLTGVRAVWRDNAPVSGCRVYFANHRSHGDFILIWAALPPALRRRARAVAGADYWLAGRLRRFIAERVFRTVLIDRKAVQGKSHPIDAMRDALAAGDSLILFPEGTRNVGDDVLDFKSGIFHLARVMPEVEFVPVWIENVGRVMPKGAVAPVPLLCTLTFGPALRISAGEPKGEFLTRARDALLALAPPPA